MQESGVTRGKPEVGCKQHASLDNIRSIMSPFSSTAYTMVLLASGFSSRMAVTKGQIGARAVLKRWACITLRHPAKKRQPPTISLGDPQAKTKFKPVPG